MAGNLAVPSRRNGVVRDCESTERAGAATGECVRCAPSLPRTLLESCELLTASLEPEDTLRNIARAATGHDLADFCVLDVLQPGGRLERLEVAHRFPEDEVLAAGLRGVALDRERPSLASRVLASGEPLLIAHVSDLDLERAAQDSKHLVLLRRVAPKSCIAVPIGAHGKLLGTMILIRTRDGVRAYGERELRVARELGRRAGLALDHARTYDAARRATRARDEALGIVAHDLRTPLNGIVMAASLVQHLLGATADPVVARALDGVLKEADRMNRLIQDLLDIAHLEAGTLSITRRAESPEELADQAVARIAPVAATSEISVASVVPADLPPIHADAQRILQVFSNLLVNAVRHTARGGRVTVGASADGGMVTFWVEDTGEGIDPERLGRLFDRFARGRSTDRRGTGFGLPIVAGIVAAHGGRVWAESTRGVGSRFCFTVPVGGSDRG